MDLLLIWGVGGHCGVVLDVARATGLFESFVLIDDDAAKIGLSCCDSLVIGGAEALPRFVGKRFAVAVGDNRIRARCFGRARREGLLPAVLIHPAAITAPSAVIGPGTVVMPGAIVNHGAAIGENCIINTGAVIEHDCFIGDHAHISPRVALGGGVRIGPYAHVGIGAVVLPGVEIGEGAVVGAGAVVLHSVQPNITVAGVPARPLPAKIIST